jgi:signal transduction histidine kinase
MGLARKLTLSLVLGVLVVLAVHAIFTVSADTAFSEQQIESDAHRAGTQLVKAMAQTYKGEGLVRALEMVDEANEDGSLVRVRWVWLNAPGDDPYAPRAPRALLGGVAVGREVHLHDTTAEGEQVLRTYVPATFMRGRPGAIEVTTSMVLQREHVRVTVRNALVTTVVLGAVCGAVALLLGGWFVGRPIRALVGKARRIGAGDLSGPLVLTQRDEIGELAEEMNAMCDRLASAAADLASAAEARIAVLEQLRHADRLSTVGKLASGIAHELGTPLNVVTGRARMIGGGELDTAETKEYAGIIVTQAQRMTRIIRQLLDFARRRGAHKSPEDLVQVARQTAGLLAPIAEKKGVELVVAEPADALIADVDASQLQQALTNLIVNGVQAMPHGGKITVSMQRTREKPPADHGGPEGEWFRLEVADEGEGMSEETMAHIFEPFFTTKPVGEGTGLGLSVTYGIIHEHGGWITVDSRPGRGATFRVYLPAPAVGA